jgi:hypothetical protein
MRGAVSGMGYGVTWWVIGPLVAMPMMMGMGLRFGPAFSEPR